MPCPTDRSGGQVANEPKLCFGPTAVKCRFQVGETESDWGCCVEWGVSYGPDVVRGSGLQSTVGAHSSAAR
jgi:hypothetical protein